MKIYDKKRLLRNLVSIAITLALIVTGVGKGFTVKSVILIILGVLIEANELHITFSREETRRQKIEEMEERNQFVRLKARSRSFGLIQNIQFVLMLLFVVLGVVRNVPLITGMGVAWGLMFTISAICELCTTLYYENHC